MSFFEGGREQCEMGGVTFNYSSVGAWSGYDPFPAASEPTEYEFVLRGEGLKDGFRHK